MALGAHFQWQLLIMMSKFSSTCGSNPNWTELDLRFRFRFTKSKFLDRTAGSRFGQLLSSLSNRPADFIVQGSQKKLLNRTEPNFDITTPSTPRTHLCVASARLHPSAHSPSPPTVSPASPLTAFWGAPASSSTTPHIARAAALLASHGHQDAQELFQLISECVREDNVRVLREGVRDGGFSGVPLQATMRWRVSLAHLTAYGDAPHMSALRIHGGDFAPVTNNSCSSTYKYTNIQT
ncbi:hypothetical protein GGX14DRAFT_408584 [Mycena pura]|uniref:Uncharacterized protein n=1 Tax=Mycena pura TaxID=153505 RepID=A0AAD6UST7_9AGAR|nr:hypothetical protein GGX14DRAFT_408584 [Mycena pura]